MCGIFGIIPGNTANIDSSLLKSVVDTLYKLSESRGKEAAGISLLCSNSIHVYKEPIPASLFIKTGKYRELLENIHASDKVNNHCAVMGHSRLVTNGRQTIEHNNQPVIKEGAVCVHNGIIVNDADLWSRFSDLNREYDVDTEVILALFSHYRKQGQSVVESVNTAFSLIQGSTSVAVMFDDLDQMIIATNNGSLYIGRNESSNCLVFASERYILDQLFKKTRLAAVCGRFHVSQVLPKSGYLIDFDGPVLNKFEMGSVAPKCCNDLTAAKRTMVVIAPQYVENDQRDAPAVSNPDIDNKLLQVDTESIMAMNRCTKCLLPESFPYIEFDNEGVCSYCHSYRHLTYKGEEALKALCDQYRKPSGQPDCIVAFSGGRDSCFTLHYVKNVLRLNPIAVSYDWGMLTDLGRRNQSRMTGALGVEHILISADIRKKRENIRKNVNAWLKSPELGTIPLFMAGDKQYFYYVNKIKNIYNLDLVIMGENHYEKTLFKNGFAGVKQQSKGSMAYNVSTMGKLKMLKYYGKQYVKNPSYINSSIIDTLGAFVSYFVIPHTYVNLFDYLKWEENIVNETLIDTYNWELATDTDTTWRIGDGTAAFYNYIYYTIAGFTENDTFRSNQIREGVLTRPEGLKLITEENRPRYQSIKWYCDTIQIDFESAIRRINSISKLYMQKKSKL